MFRTFDFRTDSVIRCKKWEQILKEKQIRYNLRTSTIVNTTYIFTVQVDDDLKFENESEVDEWELYNSDFANLKYICGLMCIPYSDVIFTYRE